MNKKVIFIMVPIIVVLLGLMAVLIAIVTFNGGDRSVFTERLAVAQKYLDDGDYSNAISYFEDAIKLDDSNEDAYLGLAEAYYKSGRVDDAIRVLEDGYAKTKSDRIRAKLDEYRGSGGSGDGVVSMGSLPDSQESGGKTLDTRLILNDTLFDMFSSYTHKQYSEKYGFKGSDTTNEGEIIVSYINLDIAFYYDKAVVRSSGEPLDEATPYKIVSLGLDKICSGAESGFSLDTLRRVPGVTDAVVKKHETNLKFIDQFNYRGCVVFFESDEAGNVAGVAVWNEIYPPQTPSAASTFTFVGTIKNATNYQTVTASTEIRVRPGENNKTGEVIDTTTTNTGEFMFKLPAGDYTLEVRPTGFIYDYFNIHVSSSDDNKKDIVVSPLVASGTIRVVLTWGSVPRDLDGHLEGTTSQNKNSHVFWSDMIAPDGAAKLDVDNTNGNGCETITINDINGSYKYYVNRFSSDGSIGSSGAVVKVYTDGRTYTITPPANVDPENWNVFEIENGAIKNINGNYD